MEETEVRAGRKGLRGPDVTRVLLLGVAASSFFSIAVMQMLTGLAFLSWVVGLVRRGRAGVRGPLTLLMAAFIVASVTSALVQGDPHGARKALSGGMPLLVFWMTLNLFDDPNSLGIAKKVVVGVAALAALYGLVQAWIEPSGFRIRGTLSHYMTYSGVLMMGACLALAGLALEGRRGLYQGVALVLLLAALLLTQTRGAWVGLAAGAVAALALIRPKLLLVLPIVAVASYLLAPAGVQQRIRSLADPNDITANERVVMWGVGWRMIQDYPILGVGPERPHDLYDAYRPEDDPFADIVAPGHLHNNLVQLTAERGLVGIGLWLAIWVGWFWLVLRAALGMERARLVERVSVIGSLAALVAFQTMGLFEYNAGDSEVATSAMFLAGLGCACLPTACTIKIEPQGSEVRS